MQPLQEGRLFDFHTSNIQRAQTKRLARRIVRLGNPIKRPPEGRSDYGLCNDKTQNGTTSLSGATALFGVQRSFLPYLFCQDRKDMARGAADAASQIAPRLRRIRTAPPEASHAIRRKKTPLPGASFTRKVIHMWMWTVYKFSVHNCATDVSQNCLWTDLISAHIYLWTNNR